MDDCIFCRIAAGKAAARLVFTDDDMVAFHDVNPQAPAHVLVIPRRHVASLSAARPGDRELLGALLLGCARVAAELGLDAGYRVVTNTGPAAGQSVAHLHFHVLGRRALGWPPG